MNLNNIIYYLSKRWTYLHKTWSKWIWYYRPCAGTTWRIRKTKSIGYIEYYNNKRIKVKLKGLSPVQYRTKSFG